MAFDVGCTNMKYERPRKAWLISWVSGPQNSYPGSKVVSILPSRTAAKTVFEAVKAIYLAAYPLTLSEKFHFGLNFEQRGLFSHLDGPERLLYGSHEYLYARKVKLLRRRQRKDGRTELLWTELPKFRYDAETHKIVTTFDEVDCSYIEGDEDRSQSDDAENSS